MIKIKNMTVDGESATGSIVFTFDNSQDLARIWALMDDIPDCSDPNGLPAWTTKPYDSDAYPPIEGSEQIHITGSDDMSAETKDAIEKVASKVDKPPIPPGIYYTLGQFYERNGFVMGLTFYQEWYDRAHEFPTSHKGLDK